jgi:hypothetical protein
VNEVSDRRPRVEPVAERRSVPRDAPWSSCGSVRPPGFFERILRWIKRSEVKADCCFWREAPITIRYWIEEDDKAVLQKKEVEEVFRDACDLWADALCGLRAVDLAQASAADTATLTLAWRRSYRLNHALAVAGFPCDCAGIASSCPRQIHFNRERGWNRKGSLCHPYDPLRHVFDLRVVMLHEVGHFFGLTPGLGGTVMSEASFCSRRELALTAEDKRRIRELYSAANVAACK